jgi:hypothetical protein
LVPILRQIAHQRLFGHLAGVFLRGFEFGLDSGDLRGRVGCPDVVGVDFPQRGMLFDLFVEQRLGNGGIVDFAVTMAAVADQVDDYVGAEPVAVFSGEAGYANPKRLLTIT